jgi:phenylacetic acid degradation operon negative regulatory protein
VTAGHVSARQGAEDPDTAVDLPRSQTGSPPQHLLITLLADYWFGRSEPLPSVALVELVGEFGVTPVGARAALSRLTRRRLLATSKYGRHTYYGLTDRAARVLEAGRRRIMSFGECSGDWDGHWTVAAFSLPEERRDLRHALRVQLRWLGFGPLYDGMWVAPRASVGETREMLDSLKITNATVLRAQEPGGPAGRPLVAAWDLASLGREYRQLIASYEPMVQRIRQGQVSAAEALISRTAVMDTWRNFPALDPDLPDELLPADWPRRDARNVFVEVYDGLGPLAVIRVRQVLARFAPELTGHVRYLTTKDAPGPSSRP